MPCNKRNTKWFSAHWLTRNTKKSHPVLHFPYDSPALGLKSYFPPFTEPFIISWFQMSLLPRPFSSYPPLGRWWLMPALKMHLPPCSYCCFRHVFTAQADQQRLPPSFSQQNKKQKQITDTVAVKKSQCAAVAYKFCCMWSHFSTASWRVCAFHWVETKCPHPAYKGNKSTVCLDRYIHPLASGVKKKNAYQIFSEFLICVHFFLVLFCFSLVWDGIFFPHFYQCYHFRCFCLGCFCEIP